MSEICWECFNKIMDTEDPQYKFILSGDEELCEECGQIKHVIVRMKRRYIWAELLRDFLSSLSERYHK